jgi:hypothetical protein
MSDSESYAVGYGKPPAHSRFQPGKSGNRGGRPRGATRIETLALEEAYRLVTVREAGEVVRLPAIQAVLRSQLALAAKGNGPAQRAIISAVNAIEQELAAAEETKKIPTGITVRFVDPKVQTAQELESGQALSREEWLARRKEAEG